MDPGEENNMDFTISCDRKCGTNQQLRGCNNSAPYKCVIGSFHENEDATQYADVACFKYLGIIALLSKLSLLLSERGSFKLY